MKPALILTYVFISMIIAYLFYAEIIRKQIYIIRNDYVFSNFNMKQELEEKYLNLERSRKDMLDSLNREYKSIINSKISDEQLQYRQDYYIQKRKEFEEDSQRIIEAYNQRIWNRINELAILYAKENNVEILFGTSGDGNIMYVDESKDVTEDFVKYINNQYNGK